jgi:hypothetical protein
MVRTGYFGEVENRLKVLLDKAFSKILWDFNVVCLNAPFIPDSALLRPGYLLLA